MDNKKEVVILAKDGNEKLIYIKNTGKTKWVDDSLFKSSYKQTKDTSGGNKDGKIK